MEFVDHDKNGFVTQTDPHIVAAKIDEWAANKQRAQEMGARAYETVIEKNINWDYVIETLLNED